MDILHSYMHQYYDYLELVKYLSFLADKDAKNFEGETAHTVAKGDIRFYLEYE